MIKKLEFIFRFYDEKGEQIGSDYGGATAYDIIGLDKSLKFIEERLKEDIKGYE